MNPVLILTHNCLELTKKCVESVKSQDIETEVLVWDNASIDGTGDWLRDTIQNGYGENKISGFWGQFSDSNRGVSVGWNWGLNYFFNAGAEHVLVANNDTVLPRWFVSSLLSYDGPFISGVSVGTMEEIASPPQRKELVPHPDFSAWLIRRECWEKVGTFDESMVNYASDLDYHLRAHKLGVPLMNAGVPFYHERSSTLRNASPKEKRIIEMQADADRLTFFEKWGFYTWSPEYAARFKEVKHV